MKRALLILFAAGLLSACNTLPPAVLPPPFGPHAPVTGTTYLFFPAGMAVTPDGALLVANANVNRRYDFGTVVSIDPDTVASYFDGRHTCPSANDPLCQPPIPANSPAVIIGNYAGPMLMSDAGDRVYTGSRDTGILNAVAVGAGGALSCLPGTGPSSTDCRSGLVNLQTVNDPSTGGPAKIDGPYSLLRGDFLPAGSTTPRAALFVSSVVPHIDSVTSGIITTSSQVAALDANDPTQVLFTLVAANAVAPANGWAPGPMVFDSARRRLFLAGCYSRIAGTGAGEPGTAKCAGNGSNLLRILDVDAQHAAEAQYVELYSDVLSTETVGLVLSDPDPATGVATSLYATLRNPDALAQVSLPTIYSQPPRVQHVTPMPITPADMLRIPRAGLSDLIAVVAEKSGALAIYDPGQQGVVSLVEGLGDSPFRIVRVPCPAAAGGDSATACLAVSVFGECRVAFVSVPLLQPQQSALRGRVGGCAPP